jgi:hypothetical protein
MDIKTGDIIKEYRTGDTDDDIVSGSSLRGGAPPIYICGLHTYVGIGHTRPKNGSDYLHFFYAFAPDPPFQLTAISKFFKLGGTERIQFAAGLSMDKCQVYVSYGVDDCFSRIATFSLRSVVDLLHAGKLPGVMFQRPYRLSEGIKSYISIDEMCADC